MSSEKTKVFGTTDQQVGKLQKPLTKAFMVLTKNSTKNGFFGQNILFHLITKSTVTLLSTSGIFCLPLT